MGEVSRAPANATPDPNTFWSLVEPYDRALRAFAYRLVGDRDLMDDALQEAYLRAFRAIPSLRGAEALKPWLYRIVYSAAMDLLRARRRTPHVALDDTVERPDPAPDPADVAAGRRDLAAALGSLAPSMRAAVLLIDAEGRSYEEASAILGIREGTVASRLSRAREVLRRALTSDSEGGTEP